MTVRETIEQKLTRALAPTFLEVRNESDQHNVPPGSESHFRVTVVADCFTDEPLLARHRRINHELTTELAGPIHALALHTYTPHEWEQRQSAPDSPPCLGGGGR